jgi:hypothetical protein
VDAFVSQPSARVRACPRCETPILWLDGEPSPELLYERVYAAGSDPKPIGCGKCAATGERTRLRSPTRVATEELLESVGREVKGAGELLTEGAEVYDRVRGFFRKLAGK